MIFIDFRVILGATWDPLWAPFCDFSVILGAKMGDSFQVHVFGDARDAVVVCAINMVKTMVFERFHFFQFFTKLVSWEMVLGDLLVTFGDLVGTFSDLLGSWRQA